MRKLTCIFKGLSLMGLGVAASLPAAAQDNIFAVSESRARTYVDVGAAVLSRNAYLGSRERKLSALPYINAEYKGRLYFKPGQGAGVNVINKDKVRLSTGVNLDFGRRASDVPVLGQSGKIDTSLTASIAARYQFRYAVLDVVGSAPVTGNLEGNQLDVLMTTLLPLGERLRLAPGVRATFQDGDRIDAYYGINAQQSQFSGLSPRSYDSGLSNVGAHALLFYKVTDNIEAIANINYSYLLGDIEDSPLVSKNSGLMVIAGIARKF